MGISLTVNIHIGTNGEVLSNHNFATPEDARISQQWPGAGIRQIAHELLVEAVRREAFTSLITKMSADPEYIQKYSDATPDVRKAIEDEMVGKVQDILLKNIQRIAAPSTQEAFQMILTQLPSDEKRVE
jgi:hypothetical protein